MSALPQRLIPWVPFVEECATQYGLDWLFVLAILERESKGGVALRPKGASGTGDFAPRRWAKYKDKPWAAARLKVLPQSPTQSQEMCVPLDETGFGKGLMQLDHCDESNFGFLDSLDVSGSPNWQNPFLNIQFGTQKLSSLVSHFSGDELCAAAAYNAGAERVTEALSNLPAQATDWNRTHAIDEVTTNKNYATDVIANRSRWRIALTAADSKTPTEGK